MSDWDKEEEVGAPGIEKEGAEASEEVEEEEEELEEEPEEDENI